MQLIKGECLGSNICQPGGSTVHVWNAGTVDNIFEYTCCTLKMLFFEKRLMCCIRW